MLQTWWDIQDTGDFIGLRKDQTEDETDFSEEGREAYEKISSIIIDKYGISSAYRNLLKKKQRYLIMMTTALGNGDKHKEWKAKVLLKEIEEKISLEDKGKREDSLIIIHKVIGGGPINPREFSLDQFYYYMDYVNRSFEQKKVA
jgi:hypothetical protein